MKNPDRGRFASELIGMCATFSEQADEGLINGYWMALEDLPIEAVSDAMRRAIREVFKMPRPAELRKLAGHVSGDAGAAEAWDEVVRQISSVGGYGQPVLAPDVREAVVSMGGWKHLCSQPTDKLNSWLKRDFIEAMSRQQARVARGRITAPKQQKALPGRVQGGDEERDGEDE